MSRCGEDINKTSCDTMSMVLQAKLKEQEAPKWVTLENLRDKWMGSNDA